MAIECIRRIVLDRLLRNSLKITRLPLDTPADMNHVPILTSSNIGTCKRCIVFVGESTHDLGILAGRLIDSDSIGFGSLTNFVEYMQAKSPEKDVGIVIANPGQLLWHRRGQKALSYLSWETIPRATAVDPPLKITNKNKIPKNEDPGEHIVCVFDEVVTPLVTRGCKIDVLAVGNSALDVVDLLQLDWKRWESCLEGCAVTSGHVWRTEFVDPKFQQFWAKVSLQLAHRDRTLASESRSSANDDQRARAYVTSTEPIGTQLTGRAHFGCAVYSSSEEYYVECIAPRIYEHVIDYFELVHRTPGYEHEIVPELEVEEQPKVAEPDWTESEGLESFENLKMQDQGDGADAEDRISEVVA